MSISQNMGIPVEIPDQEEMLILFASCNSICVGEAIRRFQKANTVFKHLREVDDLIPKHDYLKALFDIGIPVFDMLRAHWNLATTSTYDRAWAMTGDEVCDAILLEIQRRYRSGI
jgi:hypothetical protein